MANVSTACPTGVFHLSGTVSEINGKSARNLLEVLLSGQTFDETKYEQMRASKQISGGLKASKEVLIEDMRGIMTPLQRRMMRELLAHLKELNEHIWNLDVKTALIAVFFRIRNRRFNFHRF